MAAIGSLEAILKGLPVEAQRVMLNYTREWARSLRFGSPPQSEAAVRAENFGGALVPFTTSGTANAEVAVQHGLARTPRLLVPVLRLDTVNATLPDLTVEQAADMSNFYVSSSVQNASCLAYVE